MLSNAITLQNIFLKSHFAKFAIFFSLEIRATFLPVQIISEPSFSMDLLCKLIRSSSLSKIFVYSCGQSGESNLPQPLPRLGKCFPFLPTFFPNTENYFSFLPQKVLRYTAFLHLLGNVPKIERNG